jgi:hydrogenase-4 transcriptional activator
MTLHSVSAERKKAPPQSAIAPLAVRAKLSRSRVAQARLILTLTQLTERAAFPPFVFASRPMLDHLLTIDLTRLSRAPVLMTGETGTGKELLARAVHVLGSRESEKFVTYNCAEATNRELIKSELFGHRRGSFTGAIGDSTGIIRAAEGGTLFLDEIGELPLDVQPHLLRFLQGGEVRPLGVSMPIKSDVRVVAATNRDLEEEVRAGRFRADLFYRLNGVRLHIPPLRERREEIPLFIIHFLKRYQQETEREEQKPKEIRRRELRLSDDVIQALLDYDWPGNVRQLENEIRQLVLRSWNDEVIGAEFLSPELRAKPAAALTFEAEIVGDNIRIPRSLPYPIAKIELERLFIIDALGETNGNQSQAAARLRMSRVGLWKAIKKLGIDVKKGDAP